MARVGRPEWRGGISRRALGQGGLALLGGLTLVLAGGRPAQAYDRGLRDRWGFDRGGAVDRAAERAANDPDRVQEPAPRHWLVGRWYGEVQGMPGGRRNMTVYAVQEEGLVEAAWAGVRTDMLLLGEMLQLMTPSSDRVQLRRTGPRRLEGSYALRLGREAPYPLVMERG